MKIIKSMLDKITTSTHISPNEGSGTGISRNKSTNENKPVLVTKPINRLIYENGANLTFNLIISVYLLAIMTGGDATPSITLTLFCITTCAVLTKAGEMTIRLFHSTRLKARLTAAFPVGFMVISLPMVILTYKFNVSALASLLLCALIVVGFSIGITRAATTALPSNDWRDTLATLIIAITISCLARIPLSSDTTLTQLGILPITSDYFIHGITIATFGSPFATGGDMEVAGVSRIFYHYAPYVIPAAFQTVSGMSGLALSTSLLLPLGLIIGAFGVYTFATELSGRATGSVALILITCIPAYSFLVQSGWFKFYWLLLTAPGTGYAVGISAVVCTLTAIYLEKRDNRILPLVFLTLASLVVIRVHMFLLLAPTIMAVLALHRYRANARLLAGLVLGVITAAFMTLQFSESIHEAWNKYSATQIYLDIITSTFSFYGTPLTIPAALPYGLTASIQVAATLAAVLGIYFLLYPLFLWLHVHHNRLKETDAIPLFLGLFFIILIIFAPIAANGDSSEYKHRHFPLLYALLSVYTTHYAIGIATSRKVRVNDTVLLASAMTVLLISVAVFTYQGANPARPDIEKMPWTADFHNQQITPGLLEISNYLRTHAREGDVLTMGLPSVSSIGPKTQIVQFISLTGIPAFIARSELKMLGSQCVQEIVKRRLIILNELAMSDDWPAARQHLQNNGIRWYISSIGEIPKWDNGLKEGVFTSNGMNVYDAGTVSARDPGKNQC